MSRHDEPALRPPPLDAADLRGFPRWTLSSGRRVWRAHRADLGAWWFASAGDGRFDLPPPDGTCYLAASPETALRESLGAKLLHAAGLTPAFLHGRVVSALQLPVSARLADTRSSKAVDAGVTREISTITPYDLPRRWAVAFHASGAEGVRYAPRHTTGPRDVAFAVFGPAGRCHWPVDAAPRAAAVAESVGIAVVAPSRRPATISPPPE